MSKPLRSEYQTSAGGTMIRVSAGSFNMGSPESEDGHRVWEAQREVSLSRDFFLGQTPITQQQYEAVTGTNPTDHESISDAPVDSVNWEQANQYCLQLTQLDHEAGVLPEEWEYRLPTEAEWEYACRAGSAEPWAGPPLDVAWHHDNSKQSPHVVGRKNPNSWGFHDMHGNVWEWCQDWFHQAGQTRSARGGSYFNSARFCRSAQRWGWNPKSRGRYSGFRLLAASPRPLELSPPIDNFPREQRPPSIYDAMAAEDFELAQQVISADPTAIESVDFIPPPLHNCIYHDKPEMLAWLLDHGADIERREQDYGATPLVTAVVMRRDQIIRALIKRGPDTSFAMDHAERGLAGAYEDDPRLDRAGYEQVVRLLREHGIS